MFFRMVYKSGQIFLPFCHNSRVCRTDGRTDGRTDRILITIPRLHCMHCGKNTLHETLTAVPNFYFARICYSIVRLLGATVSALMCFVVQSNCWPPTKRRRI